MKGMLTGFACVALAFGSLACGNSGGGDGGGGGTPGPTITVSGTLRSLDGVVLVGNTVLIEGHVPVLTDTVGTFEIPDVTPPYTIIAIHRDKAYAVVHEGLTLEDPDLRVRFETPMHSAQVAGQVTGGVGFPYPTPPPDHRTILSARAQDAGQSASIYLDESDGTFGFTDDIPWYGYPSVTDVRLAALQWEADTTELPATYRGYGSADFVASDLSSTPGQLVALNPIPTSTVAGARTLPHGYWDDGRILFMDLPQFARFGIVSHSDSFSPVSYAVPDIAGATVRIRLSAQGPGGLQTTVVRRGIPIGATGLTFDLPPATAPVLPASGAVLVDYETRFVCEWYPSRVQVVELWAPGNAEITLVTEETEFTLPDLRAYGIGFPPGSLCSWLQTAFGPYDGVDEAVDADFMDSVEGPLYRFSTGAPPRPFTMAP